MLLLIVLHKGWALERQIQTQMEMQTQTHSPFAHPHIWSSPLSHKHTRPQTSQSTMTSSTTPPKCANCPTTTNLKRCAKCLDEWYCSRTCQKTHWKQHKKSCSSTDSSVPNPTPSSSPSSTSKPTAATKNLSTPIETPFHKLHTGIWLHDRCEKDVFKLLIDTFRLRYIDEYTFEGKINNGTVQAGEENSKPAFQQFLNLVQSKSGILPPWWSIDKTEECVAFGMESGDWSDLHHAVDKQGIIDHYGEGLMPMQMRMLYEKISGRGLMGQSGEGMLRMQMSAESGGFGGYSAMVDLGNAAKSFRASRG
jgi:splicing suppressor protein 51